MKQRLISYALLSSPIIAVYGVAPLYLFDKLNLHYSVLLCFGLSINVFVFWVINIVLHLKISYDRKWLIYLLSFVLVFFTFIPKMFIDDYLPFKNIVDQFIVYPIINTVAINTLILIICNSVLLAERKQKADAEIEQLKIEKLQSQKQILMQQLQPHFLFNSLSVLKHRQCPRLYHQIVRFFEIFGRIS
jgi:two-component system, LytTR family, sensor kinase